jgi:type II secretory pathway predicted ATPase ExeA
MQLCVVNPASDRMTVLKQLYDRLIEINQEGRRAVVLIDEAQMLQTRGLMEEFRGLLNLEIPGKKLLNLIFFGLPEVEECLRLDEPLAQRVALRYYLHALDEQSTVAYIKHRLQVAGAKNMLFSSSAVQLIYRYSGGVPRLINTLCDNCLFEAFMQKLPGVIPKIVQSIAGDLGLTIVAFDDNHQGMEQHLGKIEALLAKMEQKR